MSVQAGTRVDWRALWASGDLFRFCFVSLGILLHATNETMIATIMPAMVGDLSGVELVGWSLAVYELGAISAGAAAGRLVSYVPLRTNMMVAALFYAAGALICAAAPSMPIFLLGRLIEGLGGGALVSLAFVSVERLFAARHLAAAVRRHVGDLGRRRLCRSAVRRAGRRGAVLALGVRPVLDRRLRHGGRQLPGADRQRREGRAARRSPPPPFPLAPLACLAVAVTLIASAGVSIELVRSSVLLVARPGRPRRCSSRSTHDCPRRGCSRQGCSTGAPRSAAA